jgi:hypothetical protein
MLFVCLWIVTLQTKKTEILQVKKNKNVVFALQLSSDRTRKLKFKKFERVVSEL